MKLRLLSAFFLVLLIACGQSDMTAKPPSNGLSAASAEPHAIADLLARSPGADEVLEIDVYSGLPFNSDHANDLASCPTRDTHRILTDRYVPGYLLLVNAGFPNGSREARYPDNQPWLYAQSPQDLPFFSRLRGHMAANSQCDDAGRIFVVDGIAEVYAEHPPEDSAENMASGLISIIKLPADLHAWPTLRDENLGFTLPYPPGLNFQHKASATSDVLRESSVQLDPTAAATLRIYDHEVAFNPSDHTLGAEIFQTPAAPYYRGSGLTRQRVGPEMHGYQTGQQINETTYSTSYFFVGRGHTYELTLEYELGFHANQDSLTAFSAMLAAFSIDGRSASDPTPTFTVRPPPPGSAPLSQAAVEASIRQSYGADAIITDMQLVDAGAARGIGLNCTEIFNAPLGVWIAQIEGLVNGRIQQFQADYDALTGAQLCTDSPYGIPLVPTATPTQPPTPTPTPYTPVPYPKPEPPLRRAYPTPSR